MAKASSASGKMGGDTKMSKPKQAGGTPAKPNIFARLAQYFRDVRSEMKRVVWPERDEVFNSSVVVVVTLIFFVFFTLITDTAVVRLLGLLTGDR